MHSEMRKLKIDCIKIKIKQNKINLLKISQREPATISSQSKEKRERRTNGRKPSRSID
jgi:hypothetical protein